MAWGLGSIFKAMKQGLMNQQGFEGEGGGSGYGDDSGPLQTTRDSDYGRMLHGDKSPAYSDAMEGRFTNREERNLARRFDPSNEEDVLRMQQKLNKMGYTDEEGNPLAEDSMFGAKTERALRSFQGVDYEAPVEEEAPVEDRYGSGKGGAPGSWQNWLFHGNEPSEYGPEQRKQFFDYQDSTRNARKK